MTEFPGHLVQLALLANDNFVQFLQRIFLKAELALQFDDPFLHYLPHTIFQPLLEAGLITGNARFTALFGRKLLRSSTRSGNKFSTIDSGNLIE